MSDVQLYLLEVEKNKSEAKNIATQSASKLESKQLKLIDLIGSLEEYINNKEDGNLRAKTIAYLADVLEAVPPKVLSGQERRLLCDFILGRVEGDLEGIGSSARVLLALEQRGKWDSETAAKVVKTFVDHANPLKQFKLQTDRFAIIQLFDLLVAKYRVPMRHLQETDAGFMANFITFLEGEKDPRNLMMIFSILHVPMTEWDIHANAQDLFESVFNYFPVTFKPPPDDPYGITAQDLKIRLRDCIAANSDFAPYAFPELLNKLDSSSMNTKRDVIQAMQACIAGYEPGTINLYSIPLWDALKFEILNVQEQDLAEESLKALALIGSKFANLEGPLSAYLRPIIKECNQHLEDAPTKQSQAAGRILNAIAATYQNVADKISKGILPVLFNLYQGSESITRRRGLLEVFNQIAKAYAQSESSRMEINVEAFQERATEALGFMLRALSHAPKSEVSFRLAALAGLAQLTEIQNLLSEDQSYQAVDAVTQIVLHEQINGHGDIRSDAIKALVQIAHSAPGAVRNRAVPAFMVELPDVPTHDASFAIVLEAFAHLSSEQQVFDTVVLRLKNKLVAAGNQSAPLAYQRALLLALLYAFTYGSPMPDEDGAIRNNYFTDYAEPLINSLQATGGLNQDHQMIEATGRICNIILRAQSLHFQRSVYNKNLQWLSYAQTDSTRLEQIAVFSLYYYAALRPEVVDPGDILALLQAQSAIILGASNIDASRMSVLLRHIGLLINKFVDPKSMQATLESANIEVKSLLSADEKPHSIGLVFAIVKALMIQGKCPSLTSKYVQRLLELLSSPTSKPMARKFTTLLAPDDILTKANHCVVSGLYKQKIFNQVVPAITEAVRIADLSAKPNYLIALSGILRWLPYSMIDSSLSTLVAPLLQTLDLNEPPDHDVKASSLIIFESTLMHDPNIISEHAASLISRLLNCTTGAANTAKVRAKALQCLALLPRQLKTEAVVPYRSQVVKRLMPCLDDPKRDVRAEAVRCRTAWLGLDEGEDED